jgi:putative SOS response-associated peptidase YedK
MCGRYASAKDPDALVEEFEVEESMIDKPLHADYNVAPTKSVYAVLSRHADGAAEGSPAERQLRVVRWGLVPSWAKDPSIGARMINARAETVAEKPAFRRAFVKRRCLLPADGYYEWYTPNGDNVPLTSRGKPVKQPFYIHRADGGSLAMAGLYEWWYNKTKERDDPEAWLLTGTIITTSATDAVARIHDRMPLVIGQADWEQWLDHSVDDRAALDRLMVPAGGSQLAAYPVSVRVNSVRNNGPELIEPLPLEEAVSGSVDTDGRWPPAPS